MNDIIQEYNFNPEDFPGDEGELLRAFFEMETWSGYALLKVFQSMGVFLRGAQRYELKTLEKKLEISPSHLRLFAALLATLEKRGFLEVGDDFLRTTELLDSTSHLEIMNNLERQKEKISKRGGLEAHIRLLDVCLAAYPEILRGRISATEVLFPEGSKRLVEGVYKGNLINNFFNRLTGLAVRNYVAKRLEKDPELTLRILEVGAGTGGVSEFIFEQIKDYASRLRYYYTDISAGFTGYGKERYGSKYDFVKFEVFNVESAIEDNNESPFQKNSFDLVLGANVFHATRNIDFTLGRVKRLLKTNGLILLNEITALQDFATLTFGLTEGWWLFEEQERRIKHSPLLSLTNWERFLEARGFRRFKNLELKFSKAAGQNVMVAESDGILFSETKELEVADTSPRFDAPQNNNVGFDKDKQSDILKQTENYLKKIFGEVLKIDRNELKSRVTFDVFGVDSLVGAQILSRLEKELGKIPATLLFEYRTLADLSEYYVKNHKEALEKKSGFSVIPGEQTLKKIAPQKSRSRTEVKQNESDSDIAVIGLSGRYPGAKTLEEFWENLKAGRDSIREIPDDRWDWQDYYAPEAEEGKTYSKWGGFLDDVARFDPLFFQLSPREAAGMDPQERLMLETAWALLEDAGYTRERLGGDKRRVGVFVGVMNNYYGHVGADAFVRGERTNANSHFWSMANRISYLFDFKGPSLAVDTACSSSLTAIHLACESIRRAECESAIAGGVNLILHPAHHLALSGLQMLSKDKKNKSFSALADGFVDGEGVGAVLLKPLEKAKADRDRIYGVIKASGVNAGGKTGGYTVPNPAAQAELIEETLRKSGVNPAELSYVEAHGTGTALGDPIEIRGLTAAYEKFTNKRGYCAIGSVKSNIGHLESAAGIAALTRVLLQMKHRTLTPSLHSEELNPRIDFDNSPFFVSRKTTPWERPVNNAGGGKRSIKRRAGISSFGAGGGERSFDTGRVSRRRRRDARSAGG